MPIYRVTYEIEADSEAEAQESHPSGSSDVRVHEVTGKPTDHYDIPYNQTVLVCLGGDTPKDYILAKITGFCREKPMFVEAEHLKLPKDQVVMIAHVIENKFKVHMMAFHEPTVIREVEIPNEFLAKGTHNLLEQIFQYGQNDIQPVKSICSVSVGDVIELKNNFYVVSSYGFNFVSQADFEEYKRLPRRDRAFSKFVNGSDCFPLE